eukprot:10472412-Karenia_brevis.AAC.1
MATDAELCGPKVIRCGLLFRGVRQKLLQHRVKPRKTGPLSSMLTSLKYISWSMKDPTTLIDHRGNQVCLLQVSPARLKRLLYQAIADQHHAQ